MLKMNLHELLPANISDKAAFHVVKFVRDLAFALESIYFDRMLTHSTGVCKHDPFGYDSQDNNENPF